MVAKALLIRVSPGELLPTLHGLTRWTLRSHHLSSSPLCIRVIGSDLLSATRVRQWQSGDLNPSRAGLWRCPLNRSAPSLPEGATWLWPQLWFHLQPWTTSFPVSGPQCPHPHPGGGGSCLSLLRGQSLSVPQIQQAQWGGDSDPTESCVLSLAAGSTDQQRNCATRVGNSAVWIYTVLCTQEITNENLLYSTVVGGRREGTICL